MVTTRSHTNPSDPANPSSSPSLTSPIARKWSHTPTTLTLIWLFVSLPLVTWDISYVLLRPHSMPGGYLHSPIFTPYELYGSVDYVYGWPAYNDGDGFNGAQSTLNVVETVGYLVYLGVAWSKGTREGRGPSVKGGMWGRIEGGWGAAAAVGGFAVSVMTLSKTVLYALNEICSGYKNIGHNDAISLIFLWVIPNGAWMVLPSYMVFVFARDILQGLAIASGDVSSGPVRPVASIKAE